MPEEKESKNAMKKRLKAEAAAKKKAEKEAAKAAKEAANPKKEKKFVAGDDGDLDPTQYYSNRVAAIEKMHAEGGNAYPHKFHVSHRVPDFIQEFGSKANDGERLEGTTVSIAGRLNSVRGQGKLYFYDLKGDGDFVQIMSDLKTYESEEGFNAIHRALKRGDIVGVEGTPGKSKTGQLSIFPSKIVLLSPCLHMLPKAHGDKAAITDPEVRYRNRYLDLICNNENRRTFEIRARVISYIRRFLDERNFLEVETPSLCLLPGGATAKVRRRDEGRWGERRRERDGERASKFLHNHLIHTNISFPPPYPRRSPSRPSTTTSTRRCTCASPPSSPSRS